jgi:hypothetical protein
MRNGVTPATYCSIRGNDAPRSVSRREFLAYASIFGWIPFLRPKHISLAGARFRITRYGHSNRHYLVIHGNEETARGVLMAHLRSHQGVGYTIESHTRNVPVESGQIDPNRMFSRAGAEASLKKLNPDWPPERVAAALSVLDRGRDHLVKALFPPDGGLMVALHNNSEGYSVEDEEPISDAGSIREPNNSHAFFLCTDDDDFRKLATSPYNVVLQKKAPPEDDGSLSRLAAARGVRYVNVEVGMGHGARQKEMLDWIEWNLA